MALRTRFLVAGLALLAASTVVAVIVLSGGGPSLAAAADKVGSESVKLKFDVSMAVAGENVMSSDDLPPLPEGKRWVHLELGSSTPNAMTPSDFAEFLKNAGDVEDKGQGTINGKRVTHYAGTVSTNELAQDTGGETAKRMKALLAGQDIDLPIEAWIDEDNRPVRMAVNLEAKDGTVKITTDILEYGVPVDVQAPPAAEVAERKDLR
jgi:hypothetical protein